MLSKLRDLLLLLLVATSAQAQLSVAPAQRAGSEPSSGTRASDGMRLPDNASTRAIIMTPPTAAERATLTTMRVRAQSRTMKKVKDRGFAVGFPRTVGAPDNAIELADLAWHRTPDGARAARIALTSPGAVALRIELRFTDVPVGLSIRFRGSRERAPVFGPFAAAELSREGRSWSPVLEGETATIELELPASAELAGARVELPMISHLGMPADKLKALDTYIGEAGSCQTDVACLAPPLQQQLATATNAVARIFITVKGVTMICSGTLLNDGRGSFTPYFLTTNHCIDDVDSPATSKGLPAAAANSVNTYWFFQAATCGSLAQPNYVLLAGGAKLLARGVDYDWALVRLNGAAPEGATFAAWNASGPIGAGTNVAAVHHPSGDLKKVAQGSTFGYQYYPDGSSFVTAQWSSGATEAGSSGGGLFVLNSATGAFELRGALVGGNSSCSFQQGIDAFSRFDVTFPLVQQYLSPDAANPSKLAPVVEFFNAAKNDYLITADPAEIAALDGGAAWVRTGLRFLAYTDPSAAPVAVQPVCRLSAPPASGDTHFLSASPQECSDALASPASAWTLEIAAAFYVALPNASGICPANHDSVYRFASNANPPRRRYTAEVVLREALIDTGGWTQEGSGFAPAQVAMCAPSGNTLGIAPSVATSNYEGMWWAAPAGSESGWGLSVIHQGDAIFAAWFTHNAAGKSWWLTMTATKNGAGSYSGLLYETRGPPFSAAAFDPNAVTRNPIGAGTLTFTGPTSGTFSYAVGGVAQTKAITQLIYGQVPTCTYAAQPSFAGATNYQDLWWVPAESGWGLVVTHQGDTIFAVWYSYDVDGTPLTLSGTATRTGPATYSGTLYRTTGPPFGATPYNALAVVRTPAGSMTLTFANGNAGTFVYNVYGVTQAKAITRYLFAPPAGTLCN